MSEISPTIPRVHFKNLDILRFVAAFAIVVLHGHIAVSNWMGYPIPFRENIGNKDVPNEWGVELMRVVENWSIGVDFFFLISGFLITYLMITEIKATGTLHIGKFYVRRLLRIWPLYFLILFTAPWWTAISGMPEPNYLWNALFLNNYKAIFAGAMEPGFAHYWSICVEEHFYILWPVLLWLIPVRRLPWLFAAVIIGAVAFRFSAYFLIEEHYNHAKLNILSRMDTMAIGAWIAWYYLKKPFTFNISVGWRIAVYALFAAGMLFDNIHEYGNMCSFVFKRNLYTLFCAFLLVNYLFNPNAWFNFKKKNVLHYFGKISYGLYMYHNIVFYFLFNEVIYKYQLLSVFWFWPIYLLTVFGLSVLSYELFEKHFLKLKDRFAVVQTRP